MTNKRLSMFVKNNTTKTDHRHTESSKNLQLFSGHVFKIYSIPMVNIIKNTFFLTTYLEILRTITSDKLASMYRISFTRLHKISESTK